MKATTQQWLDFANTDLLTCESIIDNVLLTNVVAFHAQQAVEKSFKAIFEENGLNLPRIHDLIRLYSKIESEISYEVDITMLQELDTVYTTSRYPSDLGFMPEGKPTKVLAERLFQFAKHIHLNTIKMIEK